MNYLILFCKTEKAKYEDVVKIFCLQTMSEDKNVTKKQTVLTET